MNVIEPNIFNKNIIKLNLPDVGYGVFIQAIRAIILVVLQYTFLSYPEAPADRPDIAPALRQTAGYLEVASNQFEPAVRSAFS
jgi:hypothetical protein